MSESHRFNLESYGEVLRISTLETGDAGNYSCHVSNHFGRDSITYSLDVRLSRNNGVPPAPPTFSVSAATPSSITLSWSPASADGGSPLLAYRLHYHREYGSWDRVEVAPERVQYTLDGLKCGTNYLFYIQVQKGGGNIEKKLLYAIQFQAVNDFGVGERTDTAAARTTGTAPLAPASSKSLVSANSTSISLNLRSWESGGCPISRFAIPLSKACLIAFQEN